VSLTSINLKKFTAFKEIDVELSPGINVFIGENGTGKTHLLKVAYCACDITKDGRHFAQKLIATFLPDERRLGRLVHRTRRSSTCTIEVHRESKKIALSFTNHAKDPEDAQISGLGEWVAQKVKSAYIPAKEMLAHAPGFVSLYTARELHFEEVYHDIIITAFTPILKGPYDERRKKLLSILQKAIQGKVQTEGETFFLKDRQGKLEFTLLAEGIRKLALLWLLIQNGTLLEGSVLFWDEPETNLNPKLIRTVIEVLLELQRMGVQILLATHSYVVLKELDLQSKKGDKVLYHSLYRDKDGSIAHRATDEFLSLHPNAIRDTFLDLYDRDVDRELESGGSGDVAR